MKKILSVFLIALVLFASACTAPTDVEPTPLATNTPVVTATPEKTTEPSPTATPNPEEQQPYYISDEFGENRGYASLTYDVNEDGIDDTVCISYQLATKGEKYRGRKVVAIAYGGPREIKPSQDSILYIRDSLVIQETDDFTEINDSEITCIKLDDGFLIIEDTNDFGGSRIHETIFAYYFDGDNIFPIPSLDSYVKDSITVEFKSEKKYELKFLPTNQKFEGVVLDEDIESEMKFDKDYYEIGEKIVLSVNTATGEVVMRFGVNIGGYLDFQSARLDITFEFDNLLHTYTIKNVDFLYDDGTNSDEFYLEGYYEEHGTEYITP